MVLSFKICLYLLSKYAEYFG